VVGPDRWARVEANQSGVLQTLQDLLNRSSALAAQYGVKFGQSAPPAAAVPAASTTTTSGGRTSAASFSSSAGGAAARAPPAVGGGKWGAVQARQEAVLGRLADLDRKTREAAAFCINHGADANRFLLNSPATSLRPSAAPAAVGAFEESQSDGSLSEPPSATSTAGTTSTSKGNKKAQKREQQLTEAAQGGLRKVFASTSSSLSSSTSGSSSSSSSSSSISTRAPSSSLLSSSTAAAASVAAAAARAAAGTPAGDPARLTKLLATYPAGSMEARLAKESLALKIYSSEFKRVPKDYYDRPLEVRRDLLGAPGVEYLCKTIVMTNSKVDHEDVSDPGWSKYYMMIVQYHNARIHNEKLIQYVCRKIGNSKHGKKQYNFRLCPEEASAKLTGYEHNGVTPLGATTRMPILLSHRIAQLPEQSFWLGAGEVDLKWKVSRGFHSCVQSVCGGHDVRR